jgi:hypothetical protein
MAIEYRCDNCGEVVPHDAPKTIDPIGAHIDFGPLQAHLDIRMALYRNDAALCTKCKREVVEGAIAKAVEYALSTFSLFNERQA